MTLIKAVIYENAWVFSEDSPAPPDDYPSQDKVEVFLDIFLTPKHFGRIVVWKNSNLRNSGDYRIPKKGEHHIVIGSLADAVKLRGPLRLSSDYKGDMSILYVPMNASLFLNEILKCGHHAQGKSTTIGTGEGEFQLHLANGQDVGFLLSDVFNSGEHIFTFTHDAEYLLEIFR
ncbi:MAG: hypothetical protein JW810_13290 [Sedimentisphaerales bacterium]|nr:hypothetical protein [Sedimentisphaerales bacterium]